MNSKKPRILAIIGLIFMGIFTVSFIMFLVNPGMWNGAVAFITLFTGVIGIGIFFLVKHLKKKEEEINDANMTGEDGANDGENTGDSDESNT